MNYWHRFGGVNFENNKTAVIEVREAFGGLRRAYVPYHVRMDFNSKTTIKEIFNHLMDNHRAEFELQEKGVAADA